MLTLENPIMKLIRVSIISMQSKQYLNDPRFFSAIQFTIKNPYYQKV